MSLRAKLKGLYVITDPSLLPGEVLFDGVRAALEGGARVVQYRNKSCSKEQALAQIKALKTLTHDYSALLIVNDSIELCLEGNADGVHLGQSDDLIETARFTLGPDKILGITCHNDPILAERAIKHGVDYCAFGRLFPSNTKPSAPACALSTFKALCKLPCLSVGIGGISIENAQSVIDAGADMVAVIEGVFGQTDIETSAHAIASLF